MAHADHIPSDTFDCVILTQTLQVIYDVPAALATVSRILKPGGVVLATFPGITRSAATIWTAGDTIWSFTSRSARRLFEAALPGADVLIGVHGNVLAATAFLQGLAAEELRRKELDLFDPDYELLITVRVAKVEAPQ